MVDPERLGQLGAHRVERVQRGQRVLEDDRQFGAREFAALADQDWFAKLAASGFTVGQPVPIFPRLELPADAIEDEGEGKA